MIIVVAVISVVGILSAPAGIQFYRTQTINGIQTQLADTLQRARSQSVAQKNDSQFGIYLSSSVASQYVLYQGASYATRDATLDEPYQILPSTTIVFPGSNTEIDFTKHTGMPSATGTITITRDSLTRTIVIDTYGNVTAP